MASRRAVPCPIEPDVLDAVCSGRWPSRVDEALKAHLVRCADCTETAMVAAALASEWDRALSEATVPGARLVWWRAQQRARIEAARTAARPVWSAQVVAMAFVACAAVLALAAGADWLVARARLLLALAPSVLPAGLTSGELPPLLLGCLALAGLGVLVIAPVAVYLVVSEE